jgi:ligand-binding SRPBCC domain-containing protein
MFLSKAFQVDRSLCIIIEANKKDSLNHQTAIVRQPGSEIAANFKKKWSLLWFLVNSIPIWEFKIRNETNSTMLRFFVICVFSPTRALYLISQHNFCRPYKKNMVSVDGNYTM